MRDAEDAKVGSAQQVVKPIFLGLAGFTVSEAVIGLGLLPAWWHPYGLSIGVAIFVFYGITSNLCRKILDDDAVPFALCIAGLCGFGCLVAATQAQPDAIQRYYSLPYEARTEMPLRPSIVTTQLGSCVPRGMYCYHIRLDGTYIDSSGREAAQFLVRGVWGATEIRDSIGVGLGLEEGCYVPIQLETHEIELVTLDDSHWWAAVGIVLRKTESTEFPTTSQIGPGQCPTRAKTSTP